MRQDDTFLFPVCRHDSDDVTVVISRVAGCRIFDKFAFDAISWTRRQEKHLRDRCVLKKAPWTGVSGANRRQCDVVGTGFDTGTAKLCAQWRHGVSAKLHYTDAGYGHVVQHHQRTSSQQFCNLLYNKFTTNGQKFATSQHLDMSRCWALALRCGKFVVKQVVELL